MLAQCASMSHKSELYFVLNNQFRLSYAEQVKERMPVVVIIHGGFWKQMYELDNSLIDTVAPFCVSNGFVSCEVEYRRGRASVDGGAGGWPTTNNDIISALTKLHEFSLSEHCKVIVNTHSLAVKWCINTRYMQVKMDMSRVVILGHSAGIFGNTVSSDCY